jgi:DNA helicase-2/ATP-dependent DNA helicase PcrA
VSIINLKTDLNEPQLKAVTTIEGPVLIIAGAGSGKTRVITYRIAYMLERGIPQHSILALTFTNKAAKEMETRVKELTGKKLQSLTVSTFHAFGLSIIRDEAELLGFRKNFSVYDETDRVTLIKESLRECRIASKKIDLYALGQLFSNIKTGLASWNDGAGGNGPLASVDLKPVYETYQSGLKVYNAVDFDDLLTLPLELFEKTPDILAKYRKRYRYIMVDEFQDTSLIQYRLMRLLASGGMDEKNADCNVCVVGDDDQSIYSWRGADYRNLLQFEKDFPQVKEIKLEQNYRSTSTILDAANGVISHNTNRKGKNLWSPQSGGKPIELVYPENESEEADFIAAKIRELQFTEKRRYHDFGVLTRTNSLAKHIEEAFLADNIPYKVSGGTSFFQRKEIKDIISYLKIIANPQDDISLLRIINTPPRGIGRTTVAALNDIAKKNKSNIWDALSRLNQTRQDGQQHLFHDKKANTRLEEFMELIETQRDEIIERKGGPGLLGQPRLPEQPKLPWKLSQKTRALIDAIDYYSYLVVEHSSDEKKAKWKFANIEYFIKMIENWEIDPDTDNPGLYPWLNRISLITKDDGETDTLGKVSLMTIHSAKGLEFPVVFIAGAEEGLIPHEKSINPDNSANGDNSEGDNEAGSIEEERRLFYVAITRAREKLYISSCKKRRRLQSADECKPSPFLEEIPSHLIQAAQPITQEVEEEMSNDILKDIRMRLQNKS